MLTPLHQTGISFYDEANNFLLQYGESTRQAYHTDLIAWRHFADQNGFDPLNCTTAHLNLYMRHCEEILRLSKPTCARRLAALRGLYQNMQVNGLIATNPAENVRSPKFSNESVALGMSVEEVQMMFLFAEERSPRAKALIVLLATSGVRISEAINADIEDLGESRGTRTLQIVRKGSKTATIALCDGAGAAIDEYLATRTSGPIFITRTGHRWDRVQAWKEVKAVAEAAGYTQSIHPHTFRHAYVTLCLDAEIPLEQVQDSVGHASPVTTQRYNRSRNQLDNAPTFRLATKLGLI